MSEQTNIDGWMNILTGLGVRGRDKNLPTSFRTNTNFGSQELDDLYRSDGIARRIVDTVADEMIREGFKIENEPSGMAIVKFEELTGAKHINDLIKWARIYGGGLIVLGIADGKGLDEPLDLNNIRSIKWMKTYDRFSISNASGFVTTDLNSDNYGFPEQYLITDSRTAQSFVVHYTRVLRMDWNELTPRFRADNDGWGDSIFLSIFEELKNYSLSFGYTGVMFSDFVNHILKIPNLANILSSDCGDKNIKQRIDIMNMSKSVMNTVVIDGEETYEKLSTDVNGISDLLDRFMLALSAVTAIPITLLFGRAPAGLNATGETDVRNFYDMIKQKQEIKLRPILERLFQLIFLSKDGFFAGQEPEDWKIEFIPLWQNTDEQEANVRRTIAESDAIYIDRGVLSPDEVAKNRFGGAEFNINTEIDLTNRDFTSEFNDTFTD